MLSVSDLTNLHYILIFLAYLVALMGVLWISVSDLACHFRGATDCFKRRRVVKVVLSLALVLTVLAMLALALFVTGMSHGSRPDGATILLVIAGAFVLMILLVLWGIGSMLTSMLFAAVLGGYSLYILILQPNQPVHLLAAYEVAWAQKWLADAYRTGSGGLSQSESSALRWERRAAENGDADTQYSLGMRIRPGQQQRRWLAQAAEQGHAGAMAQMARLAVSPEERNRWLRLALEQDHPQALYLQGKLLMQTDLPKARSLILRAAEGNVPEAIELLVTEYSNGGVLFDDDPDEAVAWRARLRQVLGHSDTVAPGALPDVELLVRRTDAKNTNPSPRDPEQLFRRSNSIRDTKGADELALERADRYLREAARAGHPEAAYTLAIQAAGGVRSRELPQESLQWLERAAELGSINAMRDLVRHYKGLDLDRPDDLLKAQAFNVMLLNKFSEDEGGGRRSQVQHWQAELAETSKRLERAQRLQHFRDAAKGDAGQRYIYGKELLAGRDYAQGMAEIKAAADQGSLDARLDLVNRVLRGPRTLQQEVDAITELQQLAALQHLPACMQLGLRYQSVTGTVPKNLYLASQLFNKTLVDEKLSVNARRYLEQMPGFVKSLSLRDVDDVRVQLHDWYLSEEPQAKDKALLHEQYQILLTYFGPEPELLRRAEDGDRRAQYEYGQALLSRDYREAIGWIERAAQQGQEDAGYEMALRVFRSTNNPPAQYVTAVTRLRDAVSQGHIGATAFLAGQLSRGGMGGLDKDPAAARQLYQQVLASSGEPVVFSGQVSGRPIVITRESILGKLGGLEP